MSSNNQDPRMRHYSRLKRRLERFVPQLEYANALKFAAQEILDDNPIGSECSPQEISESIRSLLPPPQTVFTQQYFSQPVFPATLIKDVAALYGCLNIDPRILAELDEEKKSDPVLMVNVWLANVYDPTIERVMMMIDMYETVRIFNPLTLAMPLDPVASKTSPQSGEDRFPELGRPGTDIPIVDSQRTAVPERTHDDRSTLQDRRDSPPRDQGRPVGDPTKKAIAVQQYFRSAKYNGDMTQSLQNTLRDYNVCAMQLELSPRQKSLYFINVFGGNARDYFFEHCRDEMSYEELAKVMRNGFDNNARQLAIESELENLTFEKVMKEHDIIDANKGLTKLADKINSLFPQMPIQSQYPKNKVLFLRKAVIEQEWAKASIAQIVTSDFGFDDLLTSLREQYQLEREVHDAKSRSASVPSTLYQQYGRNPKQFHRGRGFGQNSSKHGHKRLNPIGKDGKRMLCSLCGSGEHFVRDCPPGASRNYVRSNLARGVPAVHICHDLLDGIDELSQLTSDEGTENANLSSPDSLTDAIEGPSELHLFDQVSSSSDHLEVEENEELRTSFFDKLDEDIATNFISAKIAGSAEVPVPQVLFRSGVQGSDFQEDV